MRQQKSYLIPALLILPIIGIFIFIATKSPPPSASAAVVNQVSLPLNTDSFKISVQQDGIHSLSYADLQAAGMSVTNVNPNGFEMMHRGQPVAYQLNHDGDNQFEPGEEILFYAWGFDGSRHEYLYTDTNFFWLWANGSASQIASVANETGNPVATNWRSSVTAEENEAFSNTFFRWRNQPNEPDGWYWDYLDNNVAFNVPLSLPHPDRTAGPAEVTGEFTTRINNIIRTVSVTVGTAPAMGDTWVGVANRNVGGAIPATSLSQSGTTAASVLLDGTLLSGSGAALNSDTLFNRITVDYWRQFVADGNELTFNVNAASSNDYAIRGLTAGAIGNYFVWDISTRTLPESVELVSGDLSGGVLTFGRNKAAGTYIVTTKANVKTPAAVEKFRASNIQPDRGAEWLAIAHADFIGETNRLADYRETTSLMDTYVVNVEQVINQYGYGFPTPDGIKAYVQQAYDTWSIRPQYLLLVGEATQNPDQRTCSICSNRWKTDIKTFVPTYLAFEDRFQGLIPSDHIFAMLEGNDIVPDLAVGRIAARTSIDVRNVVDKTFRYEEAVFGKESWTEKVLFLADNADGGGFFCQENATVIDGHLPAGTPTTSLCYDDYLGQSNSRALFRADMFNNLAQDTPGIVNYRGHGSISSWAGEDLMTRDDGAAWLNFTRPVVVLSADCLDSNFGASETPQSLSETFLMQQGSGSAAHWGSTGLGFSDEHSILHVAFYDALHAHGIPRIGDIINFAKTHYISLGSDESEIYAFTLHGDPALHMAAGDYNEFTTQVEVELKVGSPDSESTRTIEIRNRGTLPDTFTIALTSAPWNGQLSQTSVTIPAQSKATIVVTQQIPAGLGNGDAVVTEGTVTSFALSETRPFTFETRAGIFNLYLPIVQR